MRMFCYVETFTCARSENQLQTHIIKINVCVYASLTMVLQSYVVGHEESGMCTRTCGECAGLMNT